MGNEVYIIKDENGNAIMRSNDKEKRDETLNHMIDEGKKVTAEDKKLIME